MAYDPNADIPAFDPSLGLTKREYVATQIYCVLLTKPGLPANWLASAASAQAKDLLDRCAHDAEHPYP